MRSIIEVHHTFNNVSIKLNLEPDQLVQLWDAFSTLRELAEERVQYRHRQTEEGRQAWRKKRRFEDLRAHRFLRQTDERLESVAHILAREQQTTPESVIVRAQVTKQRVLRRYRAIRNATIRRMAAENIPYSQISDRFQLSPGRVSQIVKTHQTEGVTYQ